MKLAIYGKGGIGKSTISCNISIALARRGKKVLQIGCDPKHDSTFTLTGFLIPTIIDTLQSKDYHYENVWPEDVIYEGYGGVSCVEAGGPPAGAGCGGYVVGETVKLLKELNAFYEYDVILFDVLGDVVCGGFAAPLNYADYCIIVTDNGFDALFAANRIVASVREKARTNPLRLAGLIGNRTVQRDLIDKFVALCPMPVLEIIPLEDTVRVSRVKGKTLFEMAESDSTSSRLPSVNVVASGSNNKHQFLCDFYLNIADQLLSQPEGVVANDLPDRELFSLLSHFMSDQDDPLLMNPTTTEHRRQNVEARSVQNIENKFESQAKNDFINNSKKLDSSKKIQGNSSTEGRIEDRASMEHRIEDRASHVVVTHQQPGNFRNDQAEQSFEQNKNNLDSLDTNFMMV